MPGLTGADLPAFLGLPVLKSMNFLNEVADDYPDAISFAPGRPHERFFDGADLGRYLGRYQEYLRDELGQSERQLRSTLFQYGPSAGIINSIIAGMLSADEGIDVSPESIVVTVGCQEAICLALRVLCPGPDDVVFLTEPGYLGLVGAAEVLGVPVVSVPETSTGPDWDALAKAVEDVRAEGRRPRAVYCIPDFANPSGVVMSVADRDRLLEFAEREDLYLLEDDPYGFTARDHVPTLKALDKRRRVIHLGTFAKVCLPGPRVGYAVADQVVDAGGPGEHLLAADLATVKSMFTVNTSPIDQAVIAGMILDNGGSLAAIRKEKAAFYQRNLEVLLTELAAAFPAGSGVTWNAPPGGFFVVLDVPIHADVAALRLSAEKYGVLWTPMSFFHREDGGHRQLRLSVSYLDHPQITEGVRRLATFLADTERAQS